MGASEYVVGTDTLQAGPGDEMGMDYERQGTEFLRRFAFRLVVRFVDSRCPPWEDRRDHIHGDHYRVTVRRGRKSLSFDYWNSYQDRAAGKSPTSCDILACLSSNISAPTDPDEVAQEFGEMKPSQAIAIAKFARRLQRFFTPEEQEALMEIR